MISYKELKEALTDISYICKMTDCEVCPMRFEDNRGLHCALHVYTPNNWTDEIGNDQFEIFAKRGEQLENQ